MIKRNKMSVTVKLSAYERCLNHSHYQSYGDVPDRLCQDIKDLLADYDKLATENKDLVAAMKDVREGFELELPGQWPQQFDKLIGGPSKKCPCDGGCCTDPKCDYE